MTPALQPSRSQLRSQAKALGGETRYALFCHLVASERPLRVADLVAATGLNHNAIRQHLAKLVNAGLVVEEPSRPSGPGRPALQYRPAPAAAAWGGPNPHEWLAQRLVELADSGSTPAAVGRTAAARLAPLSFGAALDTLEDEAARLGFAPVRRGPRAGRVEVVLGCCPFAEQAASAPRVVCNLHRGYVEGVVGAAGASAEIERRDPAEGGCVVRVCPSGNSPAP